MRTKDRTKFCGNDLLDVTGVARGSRQAQRLLNVLKPHRSRVPGMSIEVSVNDFAKAFLILQMSGDGVTDELVALTCGMIGSWVRPDLADKLDAGFVMLLRDKNGVGLKTRYVARADWEAVGGEAVRAAFERPVFSPLPDPMPTTPGGLVRFYLSNPAAIEPMEPSLDPSGVENLRASSFVLYDLRAIFQDAMEAIEDFCERDSRPQSISVEDLLDAATLAAQVRDQVDSVEDELGK